jgi:hypothetical protein
LPKFFFTIGANTMQNLPLALRTKKAFAFLFLIGGGVNVFLGLLLTLLGEFNASLFVGVLFLVLGIGYLKNPVAIIDLDEISLYSPIGIRGKVYNLPAFNALELDGKTVYINHGTHRQKVQIVSWMVDKCDWQQLETLITATAMDRVQ